MHEASLIESLLEQVQAIASQSEVRGRVTTIVVDCGRLSGVEPQLAALAFQRLAPEFGLADAVLELQETPLQVRCQTCRGEQTLADLVFRCSACGSADLDVLGGDAFVLQQIVLETDVPASQSPPQP
ncbi:MAG: hydrogenase maturation nickel metallochaperone HypA [Pirellulales bacterium]